MAEPIGLTVSTAVEDAPKRTWDFWRLDNTPVTSFSEVVSMLSMDELSVAQIIANYPYPEAVPADVMLGAQRVLRS